MLSGLVTTAGADRRSTILVAVREKICSTKMVRVNLDRYDAIL